MGVSDVHEARMSLLAYKKMNKRECLCWLMKIE